MKQSTFNSLYKAAQPPAVRALLSMPESPARAQAAYELSVAGYQIDMAIDVWGWDPYVTFQQRVQFGYVNGIPCVGDPPLQSVPGITYPGVPSYLDITPLANWIKTPPLLPAAEDHGQNDAKIVAMYPPYKD